MNDGIRVFGKVPIRVIQDDRLTRNDLRVYTALSSFQGKKGQCFPSLKKLAERSGVHPSHISKHTKRLEEFGYITKTRRGKRISNVYTVKGDYAQPAGSDYAEPAKSDYAEPANSNIKTTIKRTLKTTTGGDGEIIYQNEYFTITNRMIEEFKKSYPRIQHFHPYLSAVSDKLREKETKGEVIKSPMAYLHNYLRRENEKMGKSSPPDTYAKSNFTDVYRAGVSGEPRSIAKIFKNLNINLIGDAETAPERSSQLQKTERT